MAAMEEVTEAVMSVVPLAMVVQCMADTTAAGTAGAIILPGIMGAGMGGDIILTSTVDGTAAIPITHIMAAAIGQFLGIGKTAGTHIRKVT
jgi:hypothetical protein